MTRYDFQAIGTTWHIDIFQSLDEARSAEVLSIIKTRIDVFDQAYSRFRVDSLVTKMSQKAGVYVLPDDAKPMLALYRDLYDRTEGLVTPLIGNLISDAGYDANYSLHSKKDLHAPPSWDEALEYHHPKLTMKMPVMLDFGAAGKGYLVDLVARELESMGITAYGIDAGGDIFYRNTTSARIGLEDPEDSTKVVGVCTLTEGSICGSAGNRRKWEGFNHIINPKTLSSPGNILAVWVTASTALIADALATCLFFVAPDKLEGYDFEYVLIKRDRSVEISKGFSGEIFATERVV